VKILAEEEKRRWFATTYKLLMKKCRKFWRRRRTKGIGLPLQGKDYFQDYYRGRHARVLPTATMAQAYGLTVFVRFAISRAAQTLRLNQRGLASAMV
jgi:hypothetical protein